MKGMNAKLKKRVLIILTAAAVLITAGFLYFFTGHSNKYHGMTLKVFSNEDISAGSLAAGAEKFSKKYGCSVEFTDDFENCDLIYTSDDDFSSCLPLDKYINPKSSLYTKKIITETCTVGGKIYGITNVLLGNLNYGVYYPEQFADTPIPYQYYSKNKWTWDNFIDMATALDSNVSIDWTLSYINMKNALFYQKNGEADFNYGSEEQVEWLNFVRTLIFDKGIIDNTEGAFKIGFLPEALLEDVSAGVDARYIPWPTKTGKLTDMFVDEYHFCVPESAQDPKLSVKLANYMIKSCSDTRLNLYRNSMTKEDFKILKKQLKHIYTYPKHSDYVPAKLFIDDFTHGKTVTEHIYNVENDVVNIK